MKNTVPQLKEKVWSPSLELKMQKLWKKEKVYKFNWKKARKIFVIDTPPPYPSGRPWHIGAAAQYSQIDMIARTARMLGYDVYFPIGIDRNGIPVEKYVEKTQGVSLYQIDRAKFLKMCKKVLDELEREMVGIMKRLGLSGDFDHYYRTDSETYRKLTQSTFIELFERGLIYEATRPNNYCYDCKSTIADADVVYKEVETDLVYIKFWVEELKKHLIIATTRPELLCACQAVIVNPTDERHKEFVGKKAKIPIYEREVPIIAHPSAKPEFGTGALMVCSYGDFEDVRLFRELNLKEIRAINTDGKLTEAAGPYKGLKVEEARKKIVKDLKSLDLIEKVERIKHNVPICERSKIPIEIIPMKEFYLKQLPFKEKMLKIAEKLIFLPEIHKQILINWIENLHIDWPISRRRYYGTEIPIWYCKRCGTLHLPKKGKYYQPWKQKPPFKKCKKCGSKEFVGETRVFDTWFDSSLTPLFISFYQRNEKAFKKLYPVTIRPQGRDIIRTWLYYTILRCYQLTKKLPFKYAWIGGMGLDEKGEKMSKSKGNVIDPLPLIEKYGADAFRFWNASEANQGYDFRCSEERILNALKFLTKLWNLARFISIFPYPKKAKLEASDKWILAELNELVRECLQGYKHFNFYIPAIRIKEWVWNVFASHYVEMVKARAYKFDKSSKGAWFALHEVLRTILILLAPVIPHFTDFIWRKLYGKKSIHLQKLPKPKAKSKWVDYTEPLLQFNSYVWNLKKEKNLSLKAPIKLKIPDQLKKFEKDLILMHHMVRK